MLSKKQPSKLLVEIRPLTHLDSQDFFKVFRQTCLPLDLANLLVHCNRLKLLEHGTEPLDRAQSAILSEQKPSEYWLDKTLNLLRFVRLLISLCSRQSCLRPSNWLVI